MDPLVEDVRAHDGAGELRGIDADQEDLVVLSPGDELIRKQGGVAELNCDFFCPGFFDEMF